MISVVRFVVPLLVGAAAVGWLWLAVVMLPPFADALWPRSELELRAGVAAVFLIGLAAGRRLTRTPWRDSATVPPRRRPNVLAKRGESTPDPWSDVPDEAPVPRDADAEVR